MSRIQFTIAALISILGIVLIIDFIGIEIKTYTGTVLEREHETELSRNGSGNALHRSTQPANDDEKFLLIVRRECGKVDAVKSNARLYYSKQIGQDLNYEIHHGYFTGIAWEKKAIH